MLARVVRTFVKAMPAIAVLMCAASGCVELKYSAVNRLDDKIAIRTSKAPSSVYISFSPVRDKDRPNMRYVSSALTALLKKNGFTAVTAPDTADIVINADARFYRKAHGTFLFILILPVYRFNEDFDGIAMDLTYKTDQGQWRKEYCVYYRGWLADDRDMAVDLLCKAVIADLPSLPADVDKSQNKAEISPLQ